MSKKSKVIDVGKLPLKSIDEEPERVPPLLNKKE